jgi:hypothetical protein
VVNVRSTLSRFASIASLVGPRPFALARTFGFVAARQVRRRRLRRAYRLPLPSAAVELCLPRIELWPIEQLPSPLAHAASQLREEADHVFSHRVDLLGSGLVGLGSEIDWHRDFKSGYRWPQRFYEELEVTRLDDDSDAKVPWELSRCHHFLTLARAGRLFNQERYATELESQLCGWLDSNPPGVGINWANPMEIGIRAVNLVWAVATLEEWRPLRSDVQERLIESLRWHGRHIAANLEGTPFLRSNHFLGDILGLLVLGAVLQGEPQAPYWLSFARREFEKEVMKQVYEDGVSFEASLPYHGLALEMLLIASYVATWTGQPLSTGFNERLRRMADVSLSVRHPSGRVPLFGDQDSGRILPAGFARPPTHDNLLWLAAALDTKTRPLEGTVHPEVALMFGVHRWRLAAQLPAAAPASGSKAFPIGGVFVLHSNRTHLVIRCGDVGQNGSGGHSHNDVLSYELSIDGLPVIIDSGTYAYTFDVTSRNEFRSTRAHNTVIVDGQEINPVDPESIFELHEFARPNVEACVLIGERLEFAGSHDGYRRLADPVIHTRRFLLAAATGELRVEDTLVGAASHNVQSFLHFTPGASLNRVGEKTFEVESSDGRATVSFTGVDGDELTVEEGWVSDTYGVRERAPLLIASIRRSLPASLGYAITPTLRKLG